MMNANDRSMSSGFRRIRDFLSSMLVFGKYVIFPFVLKVANGEELKTGLMTKDSKFVYKK